MIDAIEDALDIGAVRRFEAAVRRFEAAVAKRGAAAVLADALSVREVERIWAGEHPLRMAPEAG